MWGTSGVNLQPPFVQPLDANVADDTPLYLAVSPNDTSSIQVCHCRKNK